MISVSLSLQPRAAEAVLTPGVECVALKELRALRARILPSNRLLDALDLSRKKMLVVARCLRVVKFSGEFCQPFSWAKLGHVTVLRDPT